MKFTAHSFFLHAIDHAHSINDTHFFTALYILQREPAILSTLNYLIFKATHSVFQILLLLIVPTHSVLSLRASRVVAIYTISLTSPVLIAP
jgi:hypothetical protein